MPVIRYVNVYKQKYIHMIIHTSKYRHVIQSLPFFLTCHEDTVVIRRVAWSAG